jgi:hypothetical protein
MQRLGSMSLGVLALGYPRAWLRRLVRRPTAARNPAVSSSEMIAVEQPSKRLITADSDHSEKGHSENGHSGDGHQGNGRSEIVHPEIVQADQAHTNGVPTNGSHPTNGQPTNGSGSPPDQQITRDGTSH